IMDPQLQLGARTMPYDIFISHAGEDKAEVAAPLARLLRDKGVSVWLDAHVLQIGDSLRAKIDQGLRESRCGLVILSHNFFKKEWPPKELGALVESGKAILPVRHNLSHEEVRQYSPLLAEILSASTSGGLDFVAQQILERLGGDSLALEPSESRRIV